MKNRRSISVPQSSTRKIAIGAIAHCQAIDEVQKEIDNVFQHDGEFIGEILHSHLRIEVLMDSILDRDYQNTVGYSKLRWSFFQKVSLMPRKLPDEISENGPEMLEVCDLLYKGILELNAIRNKLAHKPKECLSDKDIRSMAQLISLTSSNDFKIGQTPNRIIIAEFCRIAEIKLILSSPLFGKRRKVVLRALARAFKQNILPTLSEALRKAEKLKSYSQANE